MPYTHDARISLNGSEVSEGVKNALTSVFVDLVESGISSASFTLIEGMSNDDDVSKWLDGADIVISLQHDPGTMTEVFKGDVKGMRIRRRADGNTELEIYAADKLHRLKRGEAEAVYLDTTDADLLKKLVQPHGLTSSCTLDAIKYASIMQPGCTAFELLEDRVTRMGAVLYADGETINIDKERTGAKAFTVALDEHLMAIRLVRTGAHVNPGVSVRSWDSASKAQWLGEATSGDEALLDTQKKGGSAHVKTAFSSGSEGLSEVPVRSKEEADTIAAGLMEDHSYEYATAHGTLMGLPPLFPGSTLTLEKVPTTLSGKWLVSRVRHRRDARGFTTEFEARRNVGAVS